MDKIDKLLAKLSDKERRKIKETLTKILAGKTSDFDVKKLKNRTDIFRVRIGNLRVIYKEEKEQISILAVSRRNENTYKF